MRRILLVTLLLQTALLGVRPMVSYRALELGADPWDLGMIAASFSLLSLLIAVPVGRWVDARGEGWFIVAGAGITSVCAALLTLSDSIAALTVMQAFLGCGHIVSVVAAQAWIANTAPPGSTDSRFGAFTVAVSLGQLLGPGLGGLLATRESFAGELSGPLLVMAAAAALSAAAVVASLPLLASRHRPPRSASGTSVGAQSGVRQILGWPSMLQAILASMTVLACVDLLSIYLPAYGEARGLSIATVGLLLAVRGGASLVSRLVMGRLIARFGRKRVLVVSMAVPAAQLALLPLIDGPWALTAAMIVIGFGLGLGQPITLAWVADQVPEDTRGAALGLRLSANRLGTIVIPVAVGAVAGPLGVASVFVSMAVLLAATSGLTARTPFATTARDGPDPGA